MSLAAPTLQPLAPRFLRRSLRALPPSALRGRPLTLPPSYARGSSSRLAHYLSSRAELAATSEYWAGVGCAVLQPSSTEVGAGTMNPATFLRVLGPEAWRVAYVEPSMRPDDSRFGDNPNRVQRHTQFQVILKPDPGNAQELYLGSLAALGIDSKQHDVRFVEDNWESPVLGAWGLGWEVWLDGMEITQFTYFQQAGGMPLSPVSVEITYGLERIIMSLQGVDHFKRIAYAPGVTYGELFLENEREMSCFNMLEADTERVKRRFDLYDAEAQALIDKQLAIPVFDHVLKTSHAFNILDARGAVGVTERARFFGRMRSLARQCAQLWVDTREKLDFPLGRTDADVAQPTGDTWPSADVAVQDGATSAGGEEAGERKGRMLVVEIGTEELPPDDVSSAVAQLQAAIPPLLDRLRLPYGSVRVEGTPRRVAVQVAGLAAWQQREQREVRGPPANKAFDKDGKPTKALEGFCKRNAVTAEAVTMRADDKGVEYVWASVSEESRPAWAVLGEQLPGVIAGIAFPKTMRWNSQVAFSRPIRWLLAMHGNTVVPFAYAGLASGNESWLLRNAPETRVQLPSAEEYAAAIAAAGITLSIQVRPISPCHSPCLLSRITTHHHPSAPIVTTQKIQHYDGSLSAFSKHPLTFPSSVSQMLWVYSCHLLMLLICQPAWSVQSHSVPLGVASLPPCLVPRLPMPSPNGSHLLICQERKDAIWAASSELAASVGGSIPEDARGDLLAEVANLVESPVPLLGSFDRSFLDLPPEVLVMVMRKHQRYFPVQDAASGKLLPYFVAVPNGKLDEAAVRAGNESVLRARYEDARFFYNSDTAHPLESFREKLKGITFQAKLGSMLDKSERIEAITPLLCTALPLSPSDSAAAQQAARLCMADLGTAVVMEFTGLAGIMGRHYAEREGLGEEVSVGEQGHIRVCAAALCRGLICAHHVSSSSPSSPPTSLPQVSRAIFECVLPRSAGDQLPATAPGLVLSLATRLDSLVGLFAIGCEPSASADPFGLRRSAYGLVEALVASNTDLHLSTALQAAASVQPVEVTPATLEQVESFIVRRLEQFLVDRGAAVEAVRSVLEERGSVPALAAGSVAEMEELQASGQLEKIVAAYARPTRIVRGKEVDLDWQVREELFESDAEKNLWDAFKHVDAEVSSDMSIRAFADASMALIDPLEGFFANVFVMAEDEQLRKNRLGLLSRIARLPEGIADLTVLPGF
ncbi:unnamed protein product [Closterium sp. Naga37s-1]|nr:unnamed protein product [Closterium sp. Naga37s-1]